MKCLSVFYVSVYRWFMNLCLYETINIQETIEATFEKSVILYKSLVLLYFEKKWMTTIVKTCKA